MFVAKPRQRLKSSAPRDLFFITSVGRQLQAAITTPPTLVPRRWRGEMPHMAAVFMAVFLLYAFTAPRFITLEDDGLFIANLHFWGVAHPPGYPLHTLLGGVFYHLLPFGSPAFKAHLFSGFAGAGASAAIYAIVAMLMQGRVFAYLGGLAGAATATFWSQAIIAEVYTLNALLFFILLALTLQYASFSGGDPKKHRRLFFALAAITGLGLANHYPLLLLGGVGIFLLTIPQWRRYWRLLPLGVLTAITTAAPLYGWMVWRSYAQIPANFYGPIDTVDKFLFYVGRQGYAKVDKQEWVSWQDKFFFWQDLGGDMLWEFTPLGLVLILAGCWAMLRSASLRSVWLGLFVSWFMAAPLLIMLLDFQRGLIALWVMNVYRVTAVGVMAIVLAVGASWVVQRLGAKWRGSLAALLGVVVVGGAVATHWEQNNRRHYRWANDLAHTKLASLPPQAILFTYDDLDIPLGYLHYVEGVRPDIDLYNDKGLNFNNRLFSPWPDSLQVRQNPEAALRDFIKENAARPIYYHILRRPIFNPRGGGSVFTGFFRHLAPSAQPEQVTLSEAVLQWAERHIDQSGISDIWTRQLHYGFVASLINQIGPAHLRGELAAAWTPIITRAREANVDARVFYGLAALDREEPPLDFAEELAWADAYNVAGDLRMSWKGRLRFYLYHAQLVRQLRGEADPQYERLLKKTLAQKGAGDANPAIPLLLRLYEMGGRPCDFMALVDSLCPAAGTFPNNHICSLREGFDRSQCR